MRATRAASLPLAAVSLVLAADVALAARHASADLPSDRSDAPVGASDEVAHMPSELQGQPVEIAPGVLLACLLEARGEEILRVEMRHRWDFSKFAVDEVFFFRGEYVYKRVWDSRESSSMPGWVAPYIDLFRGSCEDATANVVGDLHQQWLGLAALAFLGQPVVPEGTLSHWGHQGGCYVRDGRRTLVAFDCQALPGPMAVRVTVSTAAETATYEVPMDGQEVLRAGTCSCRAVRAGLGQVWRQIAATATHQPLETNALETVFQLSRDQVDSLDRDFYDTLAEAESVEDAAIVADGLIKRLVSRLMASAAQRSEVSRRGAPRRGPGSQARAALLQQREE